MIKIGVNLSNIRYYVIFLQFLSNLLKLMSKKDQFQSKKLQGCFNGLPCGSERKYRQCCDK